MRITLTALAATLTIAAGTARAQQLDLPRPSPLGKVSQRVGLTDVSLEYSSPGVKARKIWGALVPYDKPWRTGANAATKITFSKDVTFGGEAVPAGTYALLTVPGKTAWTVILNKNPEVSAEGYKPDTELLRAQVKATAAPHRERMTFLFTNTTDEATSLDLEWERLRVSIPIKAKTGEQALANIKSAVDGGWRPYNQAARYMLETAKSYDEGLKYADQSIAIKEEWFNVWTKAQLLAAKGNHKDALVQAKKAEEMGSKNPKGFFYADEVKKSIGEWSKKAK